MKRRTFLVGGALATSVVNSLGRRALFAAAAPVPAPATPPRVSIPDVRNGEDVFAWLDRVHGGYDVVKYRQVLGAANPYKEGDEAQGLAADDEASRENSRRLLANTTIRSLLAHPLYQDEVITFADARVDITSRRRIEPWTLGALVRFLLDHPEEQIKSIMPGLSSDVIACLVKLMSNDDLVAVGRKVFNPLPGSNLGARGYMGARTQPNSPTDDPEDIVIQVLDGWSYAVGDVVLGTNPVSSDVDQVAAIELALRDLLAAFDLQAVRRTASSRTSMSRHRSRASSRNRPPCGSRVSPASPMPTPSSTSTSRRCAGTRRSGPGASACTSRRAREQTGPTATARASTW
jgi:ethanolamine ammonia-lyase large subunit